MKKVITLTVNPAIDKSTTVAGIEPNKKLRCVEPVYEAGGGGINISKVIKELGRDSLCMYLAGGPTGIHLKKILTKANILQQIVPIENCTRENLAVTDTNTNLQYRFGMPGPEIKEQEWKQALGNLEDVLREGDYLVASGSLSPGMPQDFYANVASIAKGKKVRYILDTSGQALSNGVGEGVFLLKPNLGELSALCGIDVITSNNLESLAKKYIKEYPCEIMVISLGAKGALLVTKDNTQYISAPTVLPISTIGAGDSMLAGMALALAEGKTYSEMIKYGVACGTAATITPGSELCRKEDVDELYEWIVSNSKEPTKNLAP